MTLINVTPHPIRIYDIGVPDRIDPAEHEPILIIEPSPDVPPVRIGMIELGTQSIGEPVPVEYVEYASHSGLVHPLPAERDGVWYIVPLVVAIQQTYAMDKRGDLLVPYLEVRNLEGTMVGCKMLARPV